jgi:hypothetical protein
MAAGSCSLSADNLGEQLARYRRLGAAATRIEHRELGLTARFDDSIDLALLDQTIAIERGCCSFFTLAYETSERVLSISVDGPERIDVLELIGSALHGTGLPSDPRCPVPK